MGIVKNRSKALLVPLILFLMSLVPAYKVHAGSADVLVAQGIEKISDRDYDAAVELLEAALQKAPDDPEANFYAGFSHLRLGRYEEAEKYLLATMRLDPLEADACFELGVLYSLSSRCNEAERFFSKFGELAADQDRMASAEDLLQGCREGAGEERRFTLQVTGGGQYDNNVILEPAVPIAGEKSADFRGVLFLSADAVAVEWKGMSIELNNDFYQSLHGELDEFNVTYNRFAPEVAIIVSDTIVPTLGYAFEYTFIDGGTYSLIHEGYGSVLVKEGDYLETEFSYAFQDHTMHDTPVFENNSDRSGYRNTVGLKQRLLMKKDLEFSLFGTGEFERDVKDAMGDSLWSYDGLSVGGGIAFRIWLFDVEFEGAFVERWYREARTGGLKRHDRIGEFSVAVTHLFAERFGITLSNVTAFNGSNLDEFEYERNICGLFLTAEIL